MQDDSSLVFLNTHMVMSGNSPERNEEGLSTSTVAELLSHPLRRELLLCLQAYDEPLALADAADDLAVATTDASSLVDVDPEVVKQIYMALYHTHIPKLVEHDIIEYDQERDLIVLVDHMEQLTPFLEWAATDDSP